MCVCVCMCMCVCVVVGGGEGPWFVQLAASRAVGYVAVAYPRGPYIPPCLDQIGGVALAVRELEDL